METSVQCRERNTDWRTKIETSLLHQAPVHFLHRGSGVNLCSPRTRISLSMGDWTSHTIRESFIFGVAGQHLVESLWGLLVCADLLIYEVSSRTRGPYPALGFDASGQWWVRERLGIGDGSCQPQWFVSRGLPQACFLWRMFYWNTATPIYFHIVLQWQNWVIATETIWPTEPKILTWPFVEKFADHWKWSEMISDEQSLPLQPVRWEWS